MTFFEPIILAMILCANTTWVDKCVEEFRACNKGSVTSLRSEVCLQELEDRLECEGKMN